MPIPRYGPNPPNPTITTTKHDQIHILLAFPPCNRSTPRLCLIPVPPTDPNPGPQVLHQVPDGSVTTGSHSTPPLFDFDTISEYIIPKQALCDRLVTVCTNKYRILGYPVALEDRKYARNKFIFNFAFVLDEDVEFSTYKSVVRKVAKLFKALEEQSGFLSNEVTRNEVYALIEQVMEDLNNYSECMIPISAFWGFISV